jgi:hypothetical protein
MPRTAHRRCVLGPRSDSYESSGRSATKACRNAWSPWSRLPLPVELEPLTVPADQGFWFDDDQSIPPIAEPKPKHRTYDAILRIYEF